MKVSFLFQWISLLRQTVRRFHAFKTLLFLYAVLLGLVFPTLSGKSESYSHPFAKQLRLSFSQQTNTNPLHFCDFSETNFFEEEESDEDSDHGSGVWESTPDNLYNALTFHTENFVPCGCVDSHFPETVSLVVLHHSWKFYLS